MSPPSFKPARSDVVADDARHQRPRLDRHRLVDHAPLLRVVAHFDVADQREVLAERVPDETVVGQDAPQIRMAVEQDAEQVEGLAFEPVRRGQTSQRRYDGGSPAPKTRSAARLFGDGKQVVDHGETRGRRSCRSTAAA